MTTPWSRIATSLSDRYAIERELGQGGMATVYLAQDLKHHRRVAIKVLHPELSAVLGTDRFLKEIELTANLQHPHILPLHDSGEADGLVYYVMPYVEGESLRHRLTREKQLPVDEAVRIAREVADALDYAHRRGVVHRDIKPENILLHDGRAQVADFGIALAVSSAGAGTRMTETGMSLGTPQYMSPEQAMGERDISAKSDIYALGCVLYEMLVGETPFTGPTPQAIVARIVTEEPRSITMQRRAVPIGLEAVVHKALEKLPADRFANAAQFAEALLHPELVPGAAVQARDGTRSRARTIARGPRFAPRAVIPALAGLLLLTGAIAAWGWLGREPLRPAPVARFALIPPEGARFFDAQGVGIAMSPDGSRFVYAGVDANGQRQLFVRNFAQLEPVPIPSTVNAGSPFFSPDGQWVGFVAQGKLQKIAIAGGPALTICPLDSGFFGATWGAKGIVVFATDGGLRQVPAAGGQSKLLAAVDTVGAVGGYRFPHFLPDGGSVLFQVSSGLNVFQPAAVTLDDGKVKRFEQPGGNPRYVSTGHVVLANTDGTITAVPFDTRSLEFIGSAFPVAEGVLVGLGGAAEMGISKDGAIVYASGTAGVRAIVSVDRGGRAQPLTTEMRGYIAPRLSPEGARIAVEITDGGGNSVWIFDIAQKTLTKLTVQGSAARPVWTPDGSRTVFTAGVNDAPDIGWIRADGSALAEPLLVARGRQLADEVAPDGRTLVFHQNNLSGLRNDIMLMPLDSGRVVRPYLQTPNDEFAPAVSPDGRWLAYTSDESGRHETYVRSFPQPGAKIQVSLDGGTEARWSRGGRELFYRNGDRMMAAAVTTQPAFAVQRRTELFRGTFSSFAYHAQYDVTADGRFIMTQGPQISSDLFVMLNWFDQLRGGKGSTVAGAGAQ